MIDTGMKIKWIAPSGYVISLEREVRNGEVLIVNGTMGAVWCKCGLAEPVRVDVPGADAPDVTSDNKKGDK